MNDLEETLHLPWTDMPVSMNYFSCNYLLSGSRCIICDRKLSIWHFFLGKKNIEEYYIFDWLMVWLDYKTNDNLSTICVQFVLVLSSFCLSFFLVLSEFCHNKNKTKQRQMTNCRQIVDNLSFVFDLSCFCLQFVICLCFVLFLLWQN